MTRPSSRDRLLPLSPTGERIFAVLQGGGEMRLLDLMYELWKDRGPDDAAHVLHSQVYLLNKRLRPLGWHVRCRRVARDWRQSVYQLVRYSAWEEPDMPAHKAFDRDGIYAA